MRNHKLFSERTMLWVTLVNVVVIFLQGYGLDNGMMSAIDIVCTLLFVLEMMSKQRRMGLHNYWHDGWNVLDGVVTIVTLPSLLVYLLPPTGGLKVLVVLRALRVFKAFRAARHFPNIGEIWGGFKLALRQSAGFLVGYLIVIVVVALFNSTLFAKAAPDYFDTPLNAVYAMFQMFTVEGWYEIPNAVVGNMSPVWTHVVRLYFCLLLIGGGIIGMSLINSIFVDALAADNNDDVKAQLATMQQQADENQRRLEAQIEELTQLVKRLQQ
ncbi:MAG: ion transporter [Bacteroidales bacterium]|nr:ion transporter [Bacteroidales bacterium]